LVLLLAQQGGYSFKENSNMYRQDTFEVEIDVANEEIKNGIFLAEDSKVTFEAYIDNSGPATAIVVAKAAYAELLFEDEDGNSITLNEEETKNMEEKTFDMTEERAHELAWEARYDDRD
jgi:hypothetical protein